MLHSFRLSNKFTIRCVSLVHYSELLRITQLYLPNLWQSVGPMMLVDLRRIAQVLMALVILLVFEADLNELQVIRIMARVVVHLEKCSDI